MNVILVGHRTSGKTTLTKKVAKLLQIPYIDVDHSIHCQTKLTPEELIEQNEPRFRQLEIQTLQNIAQTHDNAIIAPGAGIQNLTAKNSCIIWIQRDGWKQSAKTQRKRLFENLDWQQELERMMQQREPRWQNAAHCTLYIPRARSIERSALELSTLISWLKLLPQSKGAQKTWLVPQKNQLTRAIQDAKTFAMAGIELRSDLYPDPDIKTLQDTTYLASVRDAPNQLWLTKYGPDASAIDLDLTTLDPDGGCKTLQDLEQNQKLKPKTLILSTHPTQNNLKAWGDLKAAALLFIKKHPNWAPFLQLKYAPTPHSIVELEQIYEYIQKEAKTLDFKLTFLPQTRAFAWMRPHLLATLNAQNYIPVGIANKQDKSAQTSPWDLQDWLPHLATELKHDLPSSFEALIGASVDGSCGDWWHRLAAQNEGKHDTSYLKIPLPKDASDTEWSALFCLAKHIKIRGFSITSPHKQRVLSLPFVRNPQKLSAANTLVYEPGDDVWIAHDTDKVGMQKTLEFIQKQGHEKGPVVMIGKGGVSPAVLGALEEEQWPVMLHVGARQGWPDGIDKKRVVLFINAAGADKVYSDGQSLSEYTLSAPEYRVHLDLHYRDVSLPKTCELHLNGDIFFEAQAKEQRRLWYQRVAK